MKIISTDTAWDAGQVINLTEDVQVAPGFTLTIAPGARINGNRHSITAFGNLSAKGEVGAEIFISETIIRPGSDPKNQGNIIIDRAQINGLPIDPPNGNAQYGTFSVTNSIISNSDSSYWYIWYPQGQNTLSGNIFIHNNAISLGINSSNNNSISITNNIFDLYENGAITNWAAYGISPTLSNNAFLMAGKPTLALQYDSSSLSSDGDYFGGATLAQINNMIFDRNDDLSITGYIKVQNVRSTPSSTLPTELFTFTSLEMPTDIVKNARILGDENVTLKGNKLDNIITVNSGNDNVDGKDGIDTVIFNGSSDQYTAAYKNGSAVVTDKISQRDGSDTLTNIEFFQFSDTTKSFDDLLLPRFEVSTNGGSANSVKPEFYRGPLTYLQYQYIDPNKNAVVTGSSSNEFLKLSNAESTGKAANGNGGTDVIDGGLGSAFLSGGSGHQNSTFFLDGRAPGVSWSTITDFAMGDNATIWGFVKGVSGFDASFNDLSTGGAAGYTGLTLHFTNLLADGLTSGSNANLNSITLTGHSITDFGASSIADLNNQINKASYNASTGQYTVNDHMIIGQTQDALGTHSYLFIH